MKIVCAKCKQQHDVLYRIANRNKKRLSTPPFYCSDCITEEDKILSTANEKEYLYWMLSQSRLHLSVLLGHLESAPTSDISNITMNDIGACGYDNQKFMDVYKDYQDAHNKIVLILQTKGYHVPNRKWTSNFRCSAELVGLSTVLVS